MLPDQKKKKKKQLLRIWQILYLLLLMAWVNAVRYNPIITTQQRQSELSIKQPYNKICANLGENRDNIF